MAQLMSIAFKAADLETKPEDRFSRRVASCATLAPRQGIVGDAKGATGNRQLNVMLAETVDELQVEGLRTAPGELGEQLIIAGLPASAGSVGVRLRIGGTAVIEVGIPRTGCARFEHIQGRPKSAVAGRLGFMARVVVGGEIAVGDEVVVETRTEAGMQGELF